MVISCAAPNGSSIVAKIAAAWVSLPGASYPSDTTVTRFYARLTEMAATEEFGAIDEVTSPDDNLQAVFQYLVK